MKHYRVTIDGRVYDVEIDDAHGARELVHAQAEGVELEALAVGV